MQLPRPFFTLFLSLLTALLLSVGTPSAARDNATQATRRVGYPGGKCVMWRLQLADKAGTPYSLSRPEEFLSRRAIARRQRQQLPLDSTDLPVSPVYIDMVMQCGVEVVGKSKWNNTLLVRMRSDKQLKKLSELPFITARTKVFASPDSISLRSRSKFRQQMEEQEKPSTHTFGATYDQLRALGGTDLHSAGYQGEGMMIAVLDGGFMNVDRIPALHGLRFGGMADFVVPRSENIFQEMDHGTMVLSAMAANVPHFYMGSAPHATYLLARCEDEYTETMAEEDHWAEAVEWADSMGVDVINSSLGYHDFDDKTQNFRYYQLNGRTAMISRTASRLAGKGIVLVNSAGNDGMGTWKKINFPADAVDILAVGAVNDHGINAPFSAVGPTADGRVKPDVVAYGSPTKVISGRGAIISDMGTSFSAPLIAGLVACLWQALPDKSAREIELIVRQSADNADHPDNIYGYGMPNFWKAYRKARSL